MGVGKAARRLPLAAIALALAPSGGCAPAYPTPFTAPDLAKAGTGKALVHYLGQPGATAVVCDRKSSGPRFLSSRQEDFAAMTAGLVDGKVRPELWQRCAMLMLDSMPADASASLLDEMAHAYRELLQRSDVETDRGEQAKVEALHRTFLLRPPGTAPHDEAVKDDVARLRVALAEHRLGPVASRDGREVLDAIDLERGVWHGAPITTATLDALAERKDEQTLQRIALRVPDASLQEQARRRIVRLHVEASGSAYVRSHAAEIEAAVMASGVDAVDLAKHPASAAWLDDQRVHVRGVLVRQDVWKQTATLLAYEGDSPGVSVIPSLDLRGALYARVAGLDEPVTVCAPPEALDVTPCLRPSDIHPTVPLVIVDAQGLLHFVERVAARDAVRLVFNTRNLPLPFEIGGKALLTIEWPIVFEKPDDVVFTGPMEGRGPDLRVVLERRYSPRILFEVAGAGRELVGVVEAKDLDGFTIATRGGPGHEGTRGIDGADGAAGSSGMPAMCPGSPGGNGGNGSPGGNGTDGGPGGPGGRGGDLVVHVTCVTGECGDVAGLVGKTVRSEGGRGGPGGEGGRGGRGGAGGQGGSGTSCTDSQGQMTFVSGGSPGMQGSDGSPGMRGANGPDGPPGKVVVRD